MVAVPLVGPTRVVYVIVRIFSLHCTFCVHVRSDCADVEMSGKAKAIRHKVQCLVCREVFDNDYVKRHTRAAHKEYI